MKKGSGMIGFRASETDRLRIEAAAAEAGQTPGQWCRSAALDKLAGDRIAAELAKLRADIGRLGRATSGGHAYAEFYQRRTEAILSSMGGKLDAAADEKLRDALAAKLQPKAEG